MKVLNFCAMFSMGLLLSGAALAQTDGPSTDSMIEQLKPKPVVRQMRSLQVERAPTMQAIPSATPTVTQVMEPTTPSANSASTVASLPAASVTQPPPPSLSLNILFDFNSDRINPESQVLLSRLADALQSSELINSQFSVEGHTDAKGNPQLNLRLSQRRAEAVCHYLNSLGVERRRLLASGKGATELANPLAPFSGENRRVKIINIQ